MLSTLAVCLCVISVGFAAMVPLSMLEDPHAKCLDGSQAGYYFQPATSDKNATKWVIYLNGGGECDQEGSCVYQTDSALGSSKYFGKLGPDPNSTNANSSNLLLNSIPNLLAT